MGDAGVVRPRRALPGQLFGAPSGSQMIAVGCDYDLDVLSAGFRLQVDVNRDPEQRLLLVRDLLQQPKDPSDPDDFACVVLADLQDTALRVGKSADPLQGLVVPGARKSISSRKSAPVLRISSS